MDYERDLHEQNQLLSGLFVRKSQTNQETTSIEDDLQSTVVNFSISPEEFSATFVQPRHRRHQGGSDTTLIKPYTKVTLEEIIDIITRLRNGQVVPDPSGWNSNHPSFLKNALWSHDSPFPLPIARSKKLLNVIPISQINFLRVSKITPDIRRVIMWYLDSAVDVFDGSLIKPGSTFYRRVCARVHCVRTYPDGLFEAKHALGLPLYFTNSSVVGEAEGIAIEHARAKNKAVNRRLENEDSNSHNYTARDGACVYFAKAKPHSHTVYNALYDVEADKRKVVSQTWDYATSSAFVRTLPLQARRTQPIYTLYRQVYENKFPKELPKCPDHYYIDNDLGWITWKHFLGTEHLPTRLAAPHTRKVKYCSYCGKLRQIWNVEEQRCKEHQDSTIYLPENCTTGRQNQNRQYLKDRKKTKLIQNGGDCLIDGCTKKAQTGRVFGGMCKKHHTINQRK